MRKSAVRVLLAAAAVLGIFIGKGSEAKAYEVVGGKAYMNFVEYDNMSRKELTKLEDGTIANDVVIMDLWPDENGTPIMVSEIIFMMSEYVPRQFFDYDWYLQKHPELIDICGSDKDAIYAYYANTGQANGWQGRIAPDKLIDVSNFDYMRYAAENPDVAAVCGQDAAALYAHYASNGIQEGRKGYSTNDLVNAYLKVYEVSSQIVNDTMSDEEKIKAVHDWMCLHIAYDHDNYVNDTIPDESYSVYGAMEKGVAVCNGYAETFKTFMDIQGIECEKIEGTAKGGHHGWNRVKVNGEDYYIDVTWDDPVPDRVGRVRYDYYLTKDPTFGGDHSQFTDPMDYYRYIGWDI